MGLADAPITHRTSPDDDARTHARARGAFVVVETPTGEEVLLTRDQAHALAAEILSASNRVTAGGPS